jgi:type I restriction enzyme M protein
MRVLELLGQSNSDFSIRPLYPSELSSLEKKTSEKNGKIYIRCPIRDKDIVAKPEEVVRQLWIDRLSKHYGYPIERMAVEYPITFGRDSSKRADIVVFDAD